MEAEHAGSPRGHIPYGLQNELVQACRPASHIAAKKRLEAHPVVVSPRILTGRISEAAQGRLCAPVGSISAW